LSSKGVSRISKVGVKSVKFRRNTCGEGSFLFWD